MWVWSLGWEDPLEEGVAAHSSILLGESHGQRSLAGCSPWGLKQLSMHTGKYLDPLGPLIRMPTAAAVPTAEALMMPNVIQ